MTQGIFDTTPSNFKERALETFLFQHQHNPTYRAYCDLLKINAQVIQEVHQIPFLPIGLFKTTKITTGNFETETIFESSGTTGSTSSKHFVKELALYEKSFRSSFFHFYGNIDQYCILGLLPSYLERGNSSLVYMVNQFIHESKHSSSGFFLYDHQQLAQIILHNESIGQKTLLIGVTYALFDFAEAFPMKLEHTIVMETGGMKGRKKEITKTEMHEFLKAKFQLEKIHSEYGMTELLSQAYSKADGIFETPQWMKILIREEDDPLNTNSFSENEITGAINVIDLANRFSCSFIATEDRGKRFSNGSFELLGRIEMSDIRGCSQMAV